MHDTSAAPQKPSLLGRLTGRTGLIAISVFLNFSGFTLIIPVVPFTVARFVAQHDVALYVSLIVAAYAICTFLAAPVLGALSDRFGRRPVLLLSLLGAAIGYLIFGIGGALWVLFLGRIVEGLTAGSISAIYAYVADTHPPQERGAAYGVLGAAGGLGFMLGPVAGGLLGQVSLSAPLYAAAVLALCNALWIYFALPESHPVEDRATRLRWREFNAAAQLLVVLRDNSLRPLFAAAFLFFAAGTMLQSNLSVFLRDLLSFNPAGIGFVLFGVGVMDIVSQGVVTPRLLPVLGERRLATVGLVINALGFVLIALVAFHPSIMLLVGSMAVFTFGDGLFQPSSSALIAHAAPAGQQGRVQGANQAQQSIARMVGPLGSAYLYPLFPGAPYFVGAVIVLAGAAILAWSRRCATNAESAARGFI
jgi:MFS transporter, DHA1 family, tetracycline resistance protein